MAKNEAISDQRKVPDAMPLRRADLVLEELDGEAILYNPRSGGVHRFSAVTLFVWDLCDGFNTPADIAARLTKVCRVDPDEARASVQRVIADLSTLDLLQGASIEPMHKTEVPGRSKPPSESVVPFVPWTLGPPEGIRLSRRELISGSATKLAFAAPVISTFFAVGAYASGPSYSGAFGDDCKNNGYSCTVNGDCCDGDCSSGICQEDPTCQPAGEICVADEDCCSDDCDQGVCQ